MAARALVLSLSLLAVSCTPGNTAADTRGHGDARALDRAQERRAPNLTTPSITNAVQPPDPNAPTYRTPTRAVVDVVDAPPTPVMIPGPRGVRIAQASYDPLPSIALVAEPFLRLAGLRINPARDERRRTSYYTGLTLQTLSDARTIEVELPAGARISRPTWAPDGRTLAFTRAAERGLELWVADAGSGRARRLIAEPVTDILSAAFTWMPDSRALLVRLVPHGQRPAEPPSAAATPTGPIVQDTSGRAATNRTYQDLLKTPHDAALFEYHAESQLAIVSLEGALERVGEVALYAGAVPSPDGRYLRVTRLNRPYSYVVPHSRFPRTVEVWTRAGAVARTLAELPAAEEVPIQGVPTGPRRFRWQPHRPATVVWAEALDGGDPRREADFRDRLMRVDITDAEAAPRELLRVEERYSGLTWTDLADTAIVQEYDRDRRWITARMHWFAEPQRAPVVLQDRSYHDRYGDPGWPVTRQRLDGTYTAIVEDGWIFLDGEGATPDGDRPFVDRLELATGATERWMRSPADAHHSFVGFAAPRAEGGPRRLIVRREAAKTPPNYFVHAPGATADALRLTDFPDPHPQLTGIEKRLLKYKRDDGVPLSGTLYLPPDYQAGERLPLVIWAYPLEYNDPDTAGQVRAAPNRFTRLGGASPLMFLLGGYAVLDRAAMPIIGDPETMNDTFIKQIAAAAAAAIDAVVDEGVADRDRVAIAGHSYGAFMTANLLAHTDLFKAGVARSGAYNRTLTPFGFQGERRTLWEATSTYVELSPMMHADKINEPLLLIHGEADNNSGTYPVQSRRLFHALQGLGGTARLVLLPHESHGYRARESVLHVLAESLDWLERHMPPEAEAVRELPDAPELGASG